MYGQSSHADAEKTDFLITERNIYFYKKIKCYIHIYIFIMNTSADGRGQNGVRNKSKIV